MFIFIFLSPSLFSLFLLGGVDRYARRIDTRNNLSFDKYTSARRACVAKRLLRDNKRTCVEAEIKPTDQEEAEINPVDRSAADQSAADWSNGLISASRSITKSTTKRQLRTTRTARTKPPAGHLRVIILVAVAVVAVAVVAAVVAVASPDEP